MDEQKVYDILRELDISFTKHEHPPVYTVDEAEQHWENITGAHCKNLFLRNKKGKNHYLVLVESGKRVNLKALTSRLGEDRLSFASPERMVRYLGLEPGAVSPFGLINDRENAVVVIIDRDLKEASHVNFHPNVNTATVGIAFADFEKFLIHCGKSIRYLSF
jgi:Ala-tRNA(Pro) deacylase